ncbi:hypothetical protein [Leptospira johnsonii]|uniref:Outer membrane protein beta-barrel domain-containing protein n=1 Tax=Leptospira johnsonii TaxID=1917820 RepID=A0A2P2D3X3_9LEPT|nr:hypothetical protein [Leptospira johnsonii]GBF39356.1 hypothetical protein LPTSP1_23570 [Leptospira johnsonii]
MKNTIGKIISTSCLLGILISATGLGAVDREPGNQTNSNWSIQYGFGYGNANVQNLGWFGNPNADILPGLLLNGGADPALLYLMSRPTPAPKGDVYSTRFYAEYAPNIIGFVFGLSSDIVQLTFPANDAAALYLLQGISNGSIPYDSYTVSSVLSTQAMQKISVNSSTLDFGINFHMNPRKTVDPYFMLGLGLGGCAHDCYAGKVFGRLGLKVNMGALYTFFEAEYTNYWFKYTEIQDALQMQGPKASMGFGLYL